MSQQPTQMNSIHVQGIKPFYCDCDDGHINLDAQWIQVLDTLPDQIFLLDRNFRIVHGNQAFAMRLGEEEKNFQGRTCYELVHRTDQPHANCPHRRLLDDHRPHQAEVHAQLFDGFYAVSVSPVYNRQTNELIGSVHVARDITHLKEMETRLRASKLFLQNVFDAFQDGISVLDHDFTVLATNHTMREWYQHHLPLEGKKCYTAYHGRDQLCPDCPCQKAMASKTTQTQEQELTGPDGRRSWLEICGFPLFDEQGQPSGIIEHVRDITKRKEAEAKLAHLALHDGLTGLGNRILLQNHFEHLMAQGDDRPSISLFVLDLDNFKPVNDRFGHLVGDQVLQEIGARLQECIREPDDIAVRMGGDEFVLLLCDLPGERAAVEPVARRVLKAVHHPMLLAGQTIRISASLGISFSPQDDTDLETLLRQADDAMYLIKKGSKNGYHFATPDLDCS